MAQTKFAEYLGISKGSQILYEKGNAPTADYLAAAGDLGVDIVYVLTGKRVEDIKPRPGTAVRTSDGKILAQVPIEAPSAAKDHATDMINLPLYSVEASAGHGSLPTTEEIVDQIAFRESFLRDLGAHPLKCSIIWAKGDSMQPTIPDGSILIVDLSQTEISNGCLYVFNVAGDLLVKRARRKLDASIELISDNEIYPLETVRKSDLDQLRVIGRVVYFCRTP